MARAQILFFDTAEFQGSFDGIIDGNNTWRYFENKQNIDSGVRDWLVIKDIDSKSTKFDLKNDVIIVEFRDFPTYMYLYLFDTGSTNVKDQLLTKNIGTINMKIINDYMSDNYL